MKGMWMICTNHMIQYDCGTCFKARHEIIPTLKNNWWCKPWDVGIPAIPWIQIYILTVSSGKGQPKSPELGAASTPCSFSSPSARSAPLGQGTLGIWDIPLGSWGVALPSGDPNPSKFKIYLYTVNRSAHLSCCLLSIYSSFDSICVSICLHMHHVLCQPSQQPCSMHRRIKRTIR